MDWLFFENKYNDNGTKLVCGVDEAGRGPLAGPVYAGAVILPVGVVVDGADDSKKLSAKKREYLYDVIIDKALASAVGFSSAQEVDELNILNATYLAMQRAVDNLKISPDFIIVDGNGLPKFDIPAQSIIKGDSLSMSVACASILAKVARDRVMLESARDYPQYGFEKHKGYGTSAHIEMIKKHGVSPIHRKTFLKKILKNEK